MSRTLNLIDVLLNSGRHLSNIGRSEEALDVLNRLADFRNLPKHVIEESQALLADLHLQRENYSQARRHLTAALAFRPLKAEYHYMMAIAIEEDDRADRKRAEMYYAHAVEFDPDNAGYWADYGTYLFRVGKSKAGLKAIRKAFALGLCEAEIVKQVAETLRREELFEEAATKLRTALFHNHGDERFLRLWHEHQFHMAREAQQEKQQALMGRKKGPVMLPFTQPTQTGKYVQLGEKTIRIDQAEPTSEPKTAILPPLRKPPKKG